MPLSSFIHTMREVSTQIAKDQVYAEPSLPNDPSAKTRQWAKEKFEQNVVYHDEKPILDFSTSFHILYKLIHR